MLKSIEIQDLRGIRRGRLDDFTELNVIVGPNNAGKSTILDAIFLGANPDPARAFGELLQRRVVLEIGNWLVRRAARHEPKFAQIAARVGGLGRITRILRGPPSPTSDGSPLELEFWQDHILVDGQAVLSGEPDDDSDNPGFTKYESNNSPPPLGVSAIRLIEPNLANGQVNLAELFSRTSESGFQKQVKELVRAVIPALEDIQVLAQRNQPVLYLLFPGVVHPIRLAGEGTVLLIKLICELATTEGGIALLEEPETHLHPAAMSQAAKALHEATKRGIQIVLTTHSLDLIDHLLAEFVGADLAKVSIFNVRLENGELKSFRLTGDEAALARTQIEDDLR